MDKSQNESALYLMRLWGEDSSIAGESSPIPAGTDGTDSAVWPRWQGKLLHVVSGEARYFSDWPSLLSILQSILPEGVAAGNEPASRVWTPDREGPAAKQPRREYSSTRTSNFQAPVPACILSSQSQCAPVQLAQGPGRRVPQSISSPQSEEETKCCPKYRAVIGIA